MSQSNSKISKVQKAELRAFKNTTYNPGEFHIVPYAGIVILTAPEFPGSKMSNVAVSIMSKDEKKFRAKVGEYHAMQKYVRGEFIKLPIEPYRYYDFAAEFAELITEYQS